MFSGVSLTFLIGHFFISCYQSHFLFFSDTVGSRVMEIKYTLEVGIIALQIARSLVQMTRV